MVSKLLLATQEIIYANLEVGNPTLGRLIDHYYEIRAGIGINKSPDLYGSFPTDPYSHTPAHKGAQQPGMTGQVKEDVLNRWGRTRSSRMGWMYPFLTPTFMHPDEFLTEADHFSYFDLDGNAQELLIQAGELAFTYCQVPVIYQRSERNCIHLNIDGENRIIDGAELDRSTSARLFARDGGIKEIRVELTLEK